MSIKLMSQVWELQSLSQARKMLLLSIADHASDEGLAWPAVATLMRKCSLKSDSGTRRAINELVELGWITKVERPKKERKGKHQQETNLYQFNLDKLQEESLRDQPVRRASSKPQPVQHEVSLCDGSPHDPTQREERQPVPGTADPSVTKDPSSNRSSCPVAEQPDGLPDDKGFLTSHPEAVVFSAKKRQWGSQEDLTCAKWIWGRIVKLYEQAAEYDGELVKPKEPNWVLWANEIRLMCTQDGRTHRQICELFDRANRDSFWCKNILSPAKLREKWDDLSLKLSNIPVHGEAVAGGHWNSEEGWRDVL